MKIFNTRQLFHTVSLTSFVMGVHSTINGVQAKELQEQLNKANNRNELLHAKISDLQDKSIQSLSENSQIRASLDEVNKTFTEVNETVNTINNTSNSEVQSSIIGDKMDELVSNVSKGRDIVEKLIDLINKGSGDGSSSSNFLDSFSELSSVISSLNIEQSLALVHISGSIAIFLSLLTIISVFYGNIIISYLKLETRFPKFKKLIELRLKFQNYYLLLNIFIILFVLVGIVYVNIIIILH
uniref:hypothetical protein n=1 Tax=Heterobasidion annosum TaxID=13563 RepID=UPI00257F8EB7|nr:hypothetical protein QU374_mgp05 [Heterobasidion annosum]WHL55376.1 hypothetical protein [Heterobasidion annosum]